MLQRKQIKINFIFLFQDVTWTKAVSIDFNLTCDNSDKCNNGLTRQSLIGTVCI